MDMDVDKIAIVNDNAKRHVSSFHASSSSSLRTSGSSSSSTVSLLHDSSSTLEQHNEEQYHHEDDDYFNTSGTDDFDLPIWELDANTDSRWNHDLIEPSCSKKMVTPPRRSCSSSAGAPILPTSLRSLPFTSTQKEGPRDIADLIEQSLNLSQNSDSSGSFSASSSPKQHRRSSRSGGKPPSPRASPSQNNDRLRKKCERMSLVF
jgi:hypothetical protein